MSKSPLLVRMSQAWFSVCLVSLAITSFLATQRTALGQKIVDDSERFGVSVLMMEPIAKPVEPTSEDELCGWGTHDSCPDTTNRNDVADTKLAGAKKVAADQHGTKESRVGQTIAAVATAFGSTVGVSVQQIVEPFAMVGPDGCSTLDEIAALTKYWTPVANSIGEVIDADSNTDDIPAQVAEQCDVDFDVVSFIPFVDFDGLIESQNSWTTPLASAVVVGTHDSITPEEANFIDWESRDDDRFGVVCLEDLVELQLDTPRLQSSSDKTNSGNHAKASLAKDSFAMKSAAVSKGTQVAGSRDEVTTKSGTERFVGSSGFVVTIDEVFLPYDLAFNNPSLRNLFPLESGSYCVFQRRQLDDKDLETPIAVDPANNKPSAEPVRVATAWESYEIQKHVAKIRRSIAPRRIGRQLGQSVASGIRSVTEIASRWPSESSTAQSDRKMESAAGKRLLARAEVDEIVPTVSINQIDQVQIDRLKQSIASWWTQAESVSSWWTSSVRPTVGQQPTVARAKQPKHR